MKWAMTSRWSWEIASDKEITEDDQEASVIKFVNQVIWEAVQGPRDGHSL